MTAPDVALRAWFATGRRTLPWREPGTSSWGVLVSEVMLQQTPVVRVLPAYAEWLARWPTPRDLASAAAADAIRQWGRLGYPRRALRLHAAAVACVQRHDGAVPDELDALLALPGVGAYTARAVLAFAFGQPVPVVDTNVRRVVARHWLGRADLARVPLDVVAELLPLDAADAVSTNLALMELGALHCASRSPRCEPCPISASCRWRQAGRPANGPAPRRQHYEGTDRQARGRMLALLRAADGPLPAASLVAAWPDPEQAERALGSLVVDWLVVELPDGRLGLPA